MSASRTLPALRSAATIRAAAASVEDDTLLASLHPKLRATRGACYADVAAEAIAVGRRGLATRLLAHELRPARQVTPLPTTITITTPCRQDCCERRVWHP